MLKLLSPESIKIYLCPALSTVSRMMGLPVRPGLQCTGLPPVSVGSDDWWSDMEGIRCCQHRWFIRSVVPR